jgi:hypothetical protein
MLLRGVAARIQQRSATLESTAQAAAAQEKAMREFLEAETQWRSRSALSHM